MKDKQDIFEFSAISTGLIVDLLKECGATGDTTKTVKQLEVITQRHLVHIHNSPLLAAMHTGASISRAADMLFDASGGDEENSLAEAAKALGKNRHRRKIAELADEYCGHFSETMRDLSDLGDEVADRAFGEILGSKNRHDIGVRKYLTSLARIWKRATGHPLGRVQCTSGLLITWASRNCRLGRPTLNPLEVIFEELYDSSFYTWPIRPTVVDGLSQSAGRSSS